MQVNALLYAMGKCADDILTTLHINEDTISYNDLIAKIEQYPKPGKIQPVSPRQETGWDPGPQRIHGVICQQPLPPG